MAQSNSLLRQITPLSDEQLDALDRLVEPLSRDQVVWIGGYLAGIAATRRDAALPGNVVDLAADDPPLTIVYGSQSGNGARIAEEVRTQATKKGFKARVKPMDEYRAADLKGEKNLLVIVSTHGEGEPPDSAKELFEFLHSRKAGKLDNTRYSVLALGDTSYEHFCKTGRDFDERMQALGAQRVHPRADCDVDYDETAAQWIEHALNALASHAKPRAVATALAPPSAKVTPLYSRKNPFLATALTNISLSGHGSGKEVRHIELSLDGSAISYEPGDSVAVIPTNEHGVVAEILAALDLAPDAKVDLGNEETTAEAALTNSCEITTLTRPVVEKYAAISDANELRDILRDAGKLREYLYGRHVVDLVQQFPVRGLGAGEFVGMLRKLPARLYSIASSHKANPGEVHATVAAVRFESHGRQRKGVASTFIAERVAEGDSMPIYVEANRNFKLPADATAPIIMVGPGTGVAPFRAFMQEREAIGARGRNWLFFGDRHFTTDFLYQREWQQYLKDGVLTRMNVAFSRDRTDKVYVQRRMLEEARDLYAWLQDGAHFYVCGDAEHMARDVHRTLTEIVAREGHLSSERAAEYVHDLQRAKRYQRDVY